MFYKVTLGLTTGATYNMTNVHVFKAAQARRAYFLILRTSTTITAHFKYVFVLIFGNLVIMEYLPTAREGYIFTGACLSTGGGLKLTRVCLLGCLCDWEVSVQRGVPGQRPLPPVVTAAVGTHSTGMHSCLVDLFLKLF